MNITMENFKTAKYDVFSIFDDRWGLCTAGTPREYNTMTIGWGTMGTIWGPPKKGKQIITVFIRESRRTYQILQKEDEFTVCFFPEKYRKDLGILGSKSGNDVPDKISLTSLTPKMLGNAVGFEEAELTFVCKKSMRSEWRKKICRNLRAILYIKMAISIICIWARLKMSLA